MSSPCTTKGPSCSEGGMNELPAELGLEICSYLEVHDQRAMRRVCQRWRSIAHLSEVFLSRYGYVDMDISKIPNKPEKPEKPHFAHILDSRHGYWTGTGYTPVDVYDRELPQRYDALEKYENYLAVTENRLEHVLNLHLQKHTKILVLRNVTFERHQFAIVAKVIQEKEADLIQLILKDCQEQDEGSAYWWVRPEYPAMRDLIPVTRKLVLDNYTMRNVLSRAVYSPEMPSNIDQSERSRSGNLKRKVPVVLPRHELDRSQSFAQLFRSFIMALDRHCPEVSPEVRSDVMELYRSWKHSNARPLQWQMLGIEIKGLNEGIYVSMKDVEESALRELDPLTLNKLTVEALHRMYCLPGQRYTASTPAVAMHVEYIG